MKRELISREDMPLGMDPKARPFDPFGPKWVRLVLGGAPFHFGFNRETNMFVALWHEGSVVYITPNPVSSVRLNELARD